MSEVQDLSNIGQKKEGKILDLKLPSPEERPLSVKEFSEFSVYNFDKVGIVLKDILNYLKGQNNVNEVYKQRLDSIELLLDNWIKAAKIEIKKEGKNDKKKG